MTASKPERKTQGIQSVEKALGILDALTNSKKPMRIVDLSQVVELATPTILRNLVSLEKFNYVQRRADGRYQLGARALQMGEQYQRNVSLETHVVPVLEKLAKLSGESTSFNVREGARRICVFTVDSPQNARASSTVGVQRNIDSTSIGKSLDVTIETLGTMRARPIFLSRGVLNDSLASISTPIFRRDKETIGALTLVAPVSRFADSQRDACVANLHDCADDLSQALGAQRFSERNYVLFDSVRHLTQS